MYALCDHSQQLNKYIHLNAMYANTVQLHTQHLNAMDIFLCLSIYKDNITSDP